MTDGEPADGATTDEETAAEASDGEATVADGETVTETDGVVASYEETAAERVLSFEAGGRRATIAQNREGYAMLAVRTADGEEVERYYGFEMAIDHAAELLGVAPGALPVPDAAADMGM